MRSAGIALLFVFLAALVPHSAIADDEQVCDVAADAALGVEDYPTAIALHKRLLNTEKRDALAHYHLGYAYGMVGNIAEEIHEYLLAISLGLGKWDLFLNLGQAYLEQHQFAKAAVALEMAVSLGSKHPETHFNLAIAYEQEKKLPEALREISTSLSLAPDDLYAANMSGVICAEMGNFDCARYHWSRLVQAAPDFSAARINLAILNRWYPTKQPETRPQATFVSAEGAIGNAVQPGSHSADSVESEARRASNILVLESVYQTKHDIFQ
jgi:tetratricopeptide (TPR) repeat protein